MKNVFKEVKEEKMFIAKHSGSFLVAIFKSLRIVWGFFS